MEVETVKPSLKYYTFGLVDGGTVKLSVERIASFVTLESNIADISIEERSLTLSLPDLITTPIMQWIVDADAIITARPQIKEFDDLYRSVEIFNEIATLRYPNLAAPEPLLAYVGIEEPSKEYFDSLFPLIDALNFLDAQSLLGIVLDKVQQLVRLVTTIQLEGLISATGKRKREDSGSVDCGSLPLMPYYKREELIRDFLIQSLPHELVRANPATEKYINPIILQGTKRFFMRGDGLYTYNGNRLIKDQTLQGKPFLCVTSSMHTLCATSTGLYGCGSNAFGELGLGAGGQHPITEWTKIEVEGEVLLMAVGSHYTIVYTTTGLYGCGINEEGELGVGDQRNRDTLTRINIPVQGAVRKIHCRYSMTLVLTTSGLLRTGPGPSDVLGEGGRIRTELKLVKFEVLPVHHIIDVGSGEAHTMVLDSTGLYGVGKHAYGQLGLPLEETNAEGELTLIKGLEFKPVAVFCGEYFTIVKASDGALYATGENTVGQLAIGYNGTHGGEIGRFIRMRGIEGEVKSVTCLRDAVVILTTKGVYQSGINVSLGMTDFQAREMIRKQKLYRHNDKLFSVEFTKLDIEMGYFSSATCIDLTVEGETDKKIRKLQCEYCSGKASILSKQKSLFCSKHCLINMNRK